MRRIVDPFKEKIVENAIKAEEEAANQAQAASLPAIDPDSSIDDILKKGLYQIQCLMRVVSRDIQSGNPHRNTVMNLKDCMAMLMELKKHEQELLDNLSDEELEKLANGGK